MAHKVIANMQIFKRQLGQLQKLSHINCHMGLPLSNISSSAVIKCSLVLQMDVLFFICSERRKSKKTRLALLHTRLPPFRKSSSSKRTKTSATCYHKKMQTGFALTQPSPAFEGCCFPKMPNKKVSYYWHSQKHFVWSCS